MFPSCCNSNASLINSRHDNLGVDLGKDGLGESVTSSRGPLGVVNEGIEEIDFGFPILGSTVKESIVLDYHFA